MTRRRGRRERVRSVPTADRSTGEQLYRLSSLAKQADVSIRTLERHIEKGLIDVVRVGPTRRIRVTESERRKYLGIMKRDDE